MPIRTPKKDLFNENAPSQNLCKIYKISHGLEEFTQVPQSPIPTATHATGGSDDADVEALAAELRKLKLDNTKLLSANQALEQENQSIRLELQNIKSVMEPDEDMHVGGEQLSARKRLERMCKRNKKGTLACTQKSFEARHPRFQAMPNS